MKRASLLSPLYAGMLALTWGSVVVSQGQPAPEGFENSVAIVDTKVLFAIGAREAEQQLRGSFGWPTFQEGFVDGVYFRFDPDGYARFSSSARLDEDVFEVVCTPGTTQCIATKGALQIGLTPSGPVQIRIEGITPTDTFFITDRKSELPLPPDVLGPLDARLETLLGSGGDLLVKREVEVIQTISLVGFHAVATYLRWVAQQQNPRVFPRGWPVPAQSEQQVAGGLTQPGQWTSPNAGPQQVNWGSAPQTPQNNFGVQTQNVTQGFGAQQQPQFGAQPQLQQQGFALQPQQNNLQAAQLAELNQLRQTVSNLQNGFGAQPQQPAAQFNPNADLGQSFAQQAQGRELTVASVAFDGFAGGGTVAPVLPQGFGATANTPFQTPQPQTFQQPAAQSSEELIRQIQTLERDLNNLRTELTTQLSSIRSMIEMMSRSAMVGAPQQQYGQAQPTDLTMLPTVGQQAPRLDGNLSPTLGLQPRGQVQAPLGTLAPQLPQTGLEPQPAGTQNISAIERLLLNRLAEQEQNQGLQLGAAAPTNPREITEMNVDRQMVEDILNELGGAAPATATAPAQQLTPTGTTDPAPSKEGFVTLSDYINQLVTKEGNDQGATAQ